MKVSFVKKVLMAVLMFEFVLHPLFCCQVFSMLGDISEDKKFLSTDVLDFEIEQSCNLYFQKHVSCLCNNLIVEENKTNVSVVLDSLKADLKNVFKQNNSNALIGSSYLLCLLENFCGLHQDQARQLAKRHKMKSAIIQYFGKKFKKNQDMDEYCDMLEETNPLFSAIFSDDIGSFEQIQSNPDFDVDSFIYIDGGRKEIPIINLVAFSGSIKIFKRLLLNGVYIDQDISQYVIKGGNLEIIRLCEQHDVDFFNMNSYATAVQCGYLNVANWILCGLMERDDQEQVRQYCFRVFIRNSIMSGNVGAIWYIVKPDKDKSTYDLIIKSIVNKSQAFKIKSLIEMGVDINLADSNGDTPLMLAVKKQKFDVIKSLLKNGAQVDVRDFSGKTELWIAAENNNVVIMSLLADYKADLNAVCDGDKNILSLCVLSKNINAIELLIEYGVEVNQKNKNGDTAFFRAVKGQNVEIINMLISAGANVNETNKEGRTALFWAVVNNRKQIIELLATQGADLNIFDNDGKTVLSEMITRGDIDMVECLLKLGADPNMVDRNNETALFRIIDISKTKVLQQLAFERKTLVPTRLMKKLKHKDAYVDRIDYIIYLMKLFNVDMNAKNNDGETAMSKASRMGNVQVAVLLEKYLYFK